MIRINEKQPGLFAVSILLFAVSIACSQEVQNGNNRQPVRPLQMLVLGDSILWGQGLKTNDKTWHYVKVWLEKSTGRQVVERIEAHSGAVIDRSTITDNLTSSNGEVNLGLLTISDQIDSALRFYSDPTTVELVLLSGCGNDVGVQKLLDASSIGEVDEMTKAKCGEPIEKLLLRLTTAFPSAQIILTGYYPFFSEQTKNDFVLKRLARRFFKSQRDDKIRTSDREVFERLKVNSIQWYQASNTTLAEAVNTINAELGQQRVVFVSVEFPAAYSFAALQTHLWALASSTLDRRLDTQTHVAQRHT